MSHDLFKYNVQENIYAKTLLWIGIILLAIAPLPLFGELSKYVAIFSAILLIVGMWVWFKTVYFQPIGDTPENYSTEE